MDGFIGRLLSFDQLIAGTVVKVLYYIGLVVLTLTTIWRFFANLFGGDFMPALYTLIAFPIAVLLLRVICEMYIVIFRISENLSAIRKMKEGGKSDSAAS